MSPYEITQPGSSIEHWNKGRGRVDAALCATFPLVWLNPERREAGTTASVRITRGWYGADIPADHQRLDQRFRELKRPWSTPARPPGRPSHSTRRTSIIGPGFMSYGWTQRICASTRPATAGRQ